MSSTPLLPWMVKPKEKTPPAPTAPPLKKQKTEVIDLTVSPPPAPANPPQTDVIQTFGIVYSSILIYPPAIEILQSSSSVMYGGIERCSAPQPNSTPISYIRVVVGPDVIGQLDNIASLAILTCPERGIHVGCVLKPGMGMTADGRMGVALVISGYRSISTRIGKVFADRGLIFKDPEPGLKIHHPFVNPQRFLAAPAPISGGTGWREAKEKDDDKEIKSQVDAIYNSLSPPEDLPEQEPDKTCVTPLFKHQKQALYFMLERERQLTVIPLKKSSQQVKDEEGKEGVISTTAESMCLWRRNRSGGRAGEFFNVITGEKWNPEEGVEGRRKRGMPYLTRGGILADDMGLGKTLEAICLVIHSDAAIEIGDDDEFVESVDLTGEDEASLKSETKVEEEINTKKVTEEKVESISKALIYEASSSSKSAAATAYPSTTSSSFKSGTSLKKMEIPANRKMINSKATLIVCPLSTISNWEDQIAQHVIRGALKIYVFHGPQRRSDPGFLSQFDVVLTTYNVLSLEYTKELKEIKRTEGKGKGIIESTLHRVKWKRIILDEAHVIKDASTGQARSACALVTELRWCLTGTPIQNRLEDLYSLAKFLRVEPFSNKTAWNRYFGKVRAEVDDSSVARLQSLTLRRNKQTKINGKPIIELPDITHHIAKINLNPTELDLYHRIEDKAYEFLHEDSPNSYVRLLELMLRLRQACVHSELCKDYESQLENITASDQDLDLKRANHLYALMKDSGEDNCCVCGISGTPILEDDNPENPFVLKCGHLFCAGCSKTMITMMKQARVVCPSCQTPLGRIDIFQIDPERVEQVEDSDYYKVDAGASTKVKALVRDLCHLKKQCDSGKIQPIKSIVFSQWTRVLDLIEVSSHYFIPKGPLTTNELNFARLDGSMSRQQRNIQLQRFKNSPVCNVILISIKAGGVGLNLTHASRVYIMEPYWNPAVEQQAIDRVHRMGQTLPVQTIRFIINDSIEESMVETQEKKKKLVSMTFKSGGKEKDVEEKSKGEQQEERLRNMTQLIFGAKGYRRNRKEGEEVDGVCVL